LLFIEIVLYCSGWCRIVIIAAIMPVLLVVVYLNLLADENSLPVAFR